MTTSDPERELTGPRWSDAVVCPRRCYYQIIEQAPTDEIPYELARKFWRGRVLGRAYQEEYQTEHPGVFLEAEVEWPHGVGHADMTEVQADKVMEVKTGRSE